MPALSTMKKYTDEIATQIALGYIYELTRKLDSLPSEVDIQLKQEVNLSTGTVDYTLKGSTGDIINNPVVKIGITPDLLRGLKRGEKAYARHSRNFPDLGELEKLVRERYITIYLLGIGNENKKLGQGCRPIHTIDQVEGMLKNES